MKIDPGTVFIIGAVLFYYLRLLRVEHERRKRQQRVEAIAAVDKKKGKKARQALEARNWLFSPRKRDWVIAAAGFLMIIAGVLIRNGVIPSANYQEYWWLPVSLGIVGFSYAFG